MKYIILITGIIAVTNLFGQEFKKIDYQVDFGTTFSIPYKKTIEIWTNIEGHPKTDYSSGFGYFFEFMISYNINTNLAIISGLNYNLNKFEIYDKIGLTESKGDLTSSYLHLPILINYSVSDKLPISISAGTYLEFLINAREKGTSYIDTAGFVFGDVPDPVIVAIEPVQDYNNDIKKNYKDFDFGLSVQLDYKLTLSDRLLCVVFSRFNYGLLDVITNDIQVNSSASKWKNYNLLIGIGLKL
ncbi:MAG: PorT family protein [Bacteroidales bacterium]|nr:PorT family protein [Bacteroidales bacterium]